MEPVKKLFPFLLEEYYGYSIMLARYFYIAGYTHKNVVQATKKRIDLIYQAAKENIFDIYQDKSKLPRLPEAWINKNILKDELNPFLAIKPLPTFYDIAAMAYLPRKLLDENTRKKIEEIIRYIMTPEFQKLPEGYGLLWNKPIKRYHSCGWSPTLPYFKNFAHSKNYDQFHLLYYFDFMTCFKITQNSQWYINSLKRLEKFRTKNGTYLFPKEILNKKFIPEAYLNDTNLKLKRNKREELIREIASTLYMYRIYKRIHEDQEVK